jgi:PAT family beta-lactamase induction signal transducer AmpG
MATALLTPFYLDLGFSKTEIGTVAKFAALWASVAGATLGGILMIRIGINRSLWCFGVVQLLTILGFAALNEAGNDPNVIHIDLIWWQIDVSLGQFWLFLVVSAEYLGVGLGTAAFVAYMARATDRRYTATQYALLTSVMGIPRTFANASTGFIVEGVGWTNFFLLCALIAIPGMILLKWVAPWGADPVVEDAPERSVPPA